MLLLYHILLVDESYQALFYFEPKIANLQRLYYKLFLHQIQP